MPASVSAVAPSTTPAAPANRRQRLRLRDLCDEVLASFRVAHERDVISADERADAQSVLAGIGPRRKAA